MSNPIYTPALLQKARSILSNPASTAHARSVASEALRLADALDPDAGLPKASREAIDAAFGTGPKSESGRGTVRTQGGFVAEFQPLDHDAAVKRLRELEAT